MGAEVWPMLHAERSDFVDYLRTLDPADWDKPSLAEGWRVKDVVAHLIAGAKSTPPSFLRAMIGAGMSFDTMNAKAISREVDRTPDEFVSALESLVATRTRPGKALLGEIIVHGEDVRRALGTPGTYPTEHLTVVADNYRRAGAPIRGKQRIKALALTATDTDWSAGDGATVSGPMLALVLAMTGRPVGLGELTGDGVPVLAEHQKLS
jgi:uncharacterized protein (TIGR03083 family)